MKLMKTLTALSLAGVMSASSLMCAFADGPADPATTDRQARLKDNVLEYDEIYDLVNTYNTTVQNNNRSYNSMSKESLNELADYFLDKADELEEMADAMDSQYDDKVNSGEYAGAAELLETIAGIKLSAKRFKQQAQASTSDSQSTKLQFEQIKYGIVMTAQNIMAQYNQGINNLPYLYASKELLENALVTAQTQLSLGMNTQQDVLTAQKNLDDMNNTIKSTEDSLKNATNSLGQMTGWSVNSSPEIRQMPAADPSFVDTIDLQADIKKAIGNSFSLRILRRALNNAATSSAEKNTRTEITDGEQTVTNTVNQKYTALLQKKSAYDSAKIAFDLEASKTATAQQKFTLGLISAIELKQQLSSYNSKEAELKNADINLFMAIEDYKWTVDKGMGGASS